MNKNAKRFLSFVLAGSLVAGVPVSSNAQSNNEEKSITTRENTLSYTVCDGDNLGLISEMYFGSPKYALELARFNHIKNPELIFSGQIIRIPEYLHKYLVDTYPREFAPDTYYTIEEGDYLFKIVKEQYDEDSILYVNKLATYNELDDPNIIRVGDVLAIPEKAKLYRIEPNDYSLQYQMLEFRMAHPGEDYPDWILEALEVQNELKLELKK